jgi:MinD-like ATPase involved in chromosome partitioning or flagellar assembly
MSLNKGRPVVLEEPDSQVSKSIRQLAERFASGAEHQNGEVGESMFPERSKRGLFRRH